jgi:hypothetical protein
VKTVAKTDMNKKVTRIVERSYEVDKSCDIYKDVYMRMPGKLSDLRKPIVR